MTIDELIRRAAAQTPISVQQEVFVSGPELRALMEKGGMTVAEIMAHPDQRREVRTYRYGHVLGPGLSREVIRAWQAAHPEHPLPADLAELLERVNGIHLWAELDSGRAYVGILPLEEWREATEDLWQYFEPRVLGTLIISYHGNSDAFLALDARERRYLWVDVHDIHPKLIASTTEGLLDFWWEECGWLDPRKTR
ncbi:MAG: SMI1/KNR4 family protein [Planctomycetota bacterium]